MKTVSQFFLCVCASFAFYSNTALADKPTCHSSSGGYCSYNGYVKDLYINSGGLILLYFDTPFESDQDANTAGFTLAGNGLYATAIQMSDNPEFAKLFYSTALSAQATKRKIRIQMRNNLGGYLKTDRIWIAQE
ncbi:hypothetical protein QSV34_00015 [Porticoccus sp. W117]|uniref:hypothetical protein n=1 Tax=Porticoccus sp. W117 TaxID=3054777 RepID=UPI002593DE71|nr:hypothetical protein [Porticoccus sp. W117]MDM3869725.1 hypothetical protein [Porticoccus sp. W117]